MRRLSANSDRARAQLLAAAREIVQHRGVAALTLANLDLQASGQPHQLDITATGQAEQGPWRGTLDTQGRLQLGSAQRPDIDSGRLDLTRLQLRATDSARKDRVVDWTLNSPAPLQARWQKARCALTLHPDGRIYALVRTDNESGFGSGYLHHLLRGEDGENAFSSFVIFFISNFSQHLFTVELLFSWPCRPPSLSLSREQEHITTILLPPVAWGR